MHVVCLRALFISISGVSLSLCAPFRWLSCVRSRSLRSLIESLKNDFQPNGRVYHMLIKPTNLNRYLGQSLCGVFLLPVCCFVVVAVLSFSYMRIHFELCLFLARDKYVNIDSNSS